MVRAAACPLNTTVNEAPDDAGVMTAGKLVSASDLE